MRVKTLRSKRSAGAWGIRVQKAIKSMKFHQLMAPCVSTSYIHAVCTRTGTTHKNKLAFCWAAHLSFLSLLFLSLRRMSCFLSDKIFLPLGASVSKLPLEAESILLFLIRGESSLRRWNRARAARRALTRDSSKFPTHTRLRHL
jgi:hypothetical protein